MSREPGFFFPVIDRNRCDGQGRCMSVCPRQVFEVRTIEAEDHDALSRLGRLRSALNGRRTAYTPNAAQCEACGLCLDACAQDAISLITF